MSKTLTEAALSTRSARCKLTPGVHWRSIDPDTHLGYRRGQRGGRWVVRWYAGDGAYQQKTIGTADDAIDADGMTVFDFAQALANARKVVTQHRADAAASAAGSPITVRSAMEEYAAARERRETQQGAAKRDARSRLTKHVLGDKDIADLALHKLTEASIAGWRDRLPVSLAATSVRRTANDFRAALNFAARRHRARLPTHIPVVIKNGFAIEERGAGGAVARPAQVLTDADVRRIVAAAYEVDDEQEMGGDLSRLIILLAATGARYSQITRATVADVQTAQRRIMIPVSRKGAGTKRADRIAVRIGDDVLATLRSVMAGRRGTDSLLERWRWKQVQPTKWVKEHRGAWGPSDLQRPWAAIIAKAELPADVVPYSLRHSSIVRGLRANLPIRLVAALHDTSSTMIEKHYAAFIVDALDELAATALIPLAGAAVAELKKVADTDHR